MNGYQLHAWIQLRSSMEHEVFKVQGFCVIWGSGVMAPRKILKLRSSEIVFLAILLLI